ncbi:FecCD family ABC transporter permease [Yersinia frederiksenii]|uniref:FecCD family ABC transporter permease n=1 Tax=Yersinia frederiksenii TaxID=29484 RepID=UPI0011A9BDBF|nr:iron ABC transporter permease [Yersinia frederiksenii]
MPHTGRAFLQLRRGLLTLALLGSLLVAALIDLAVGAVNLNPLDIMRMLWPSSAPSDDLYQVVFWSIRLPMTLTAVVVGASLALAGLLMQTVLANPLASPYTLGISAAAGFGAALSIITGFSLGGTLALGTPLLASLMALLACVPIYMLGQSRGMTPQILVLSGIVVLFFFQSLQSLMLFLASPEAMQQIVFWLFGSLLKANMHGVTITGSVLICSLFISLRQAWCLTALSAGEEQAQGLGINVSALRKVAFLLATLLTAASVSFVGTIGFIGLIAPHFARLLVGEDQRYLICISALCGSLLLLCASIIAKLVLPNGVVPIGIVIALIGVPVLLYFVIRQVKRP